ncbi:MAG: hypothetical protein PWR01_3370 [Clostridiales bacterium]|jgi:hypothetical protein|nr:hypothetical protein [Clostridiales bacterium]MDN5282297.1 hypothetical protein [Candidatus Ozemobacter sp.]
MRLRSLFFSYLSLVYQSRLCDGTLNMHASGEQGAFRIAYLLQFLHSG